MCKCSLECVPIKKHPPGINWFGHTENVPIFLHIWETMKNVNKIQSYMPYKCWKDVWFLWSLTEELPSPKLSVPKQSLPSPSALYPDDDSRLLLMLQIQRWWLALVSGCLLLNEHLHNLNSATVFWSSITNYNYTAIHCKFCPGRKI